MGVHVVAIGGQDLINGRLPGLYSRRLLLPFPNEEIRRQHASSRAVSPPLLPGRALDAGTGQHVQICRPGRDAADLTAASPLPRPDLPQRSDGPSRSVLPQRFPSLPVRVAAGALAVPDPPPSPTWIPIGVGGTAGSTIGVDLVDAGPQLVLVSGPAGSGRTTAAATLAAGLRRAGLGVLAIAPPRSPLPGLLPDDAGVRVIRGTTLKDADLRDAATEFGDGQYAVVVDDCEQITVTPSQEGFVDAPTLLQEIASPGALGRQALVLCGDALPILAGQRRALSRVVNEVMTDGVRVLLTPTSPATAREHGIPLEPDQFFAGPPGRGYLTTGRVVDLIQLAVPAE